jgi:hypothetical protein
MVFGKVPVSPRLLRQAAIIGLRRIGKKEKTDRKDVVWKGRR